jgi:hypothetical protein
MELTRLLAKAWTLSCLYAGAVALNSAFAGSSDVPAALIAIAGTVLLFLAMGLVFAAGGLFLSGRASMLKRKWWRKHPFRLECGFDEGVFVVFAVLSFADQAFFAPRHLSGAVTTALEQAIYFAVPGQRAFVGLARPCLFDGGRIFASAFSWSLALIYLGSTLSRLKLRVARIRLRRAAAPAAAGGRVDTVFLSVATIAGIQLLYVGSGYTFMPCSMLAGVAGALVVGLAPLMLAYAAVACLSLLCAAGKA